MRQPTNKKIRLIEWVLLNERSIRLAVIEERERQKEYAGEDPTGRTAVRLASPIGLLVVGGKELKRPEEWLRILELVYHHIPKGDMLEVLKARYKRREHYSVTCSRLAMSQGKYQNTVRKVRDYVQMVAIQEGLIRIVD